MIRILSRHMAHHYWLTSHLPSAMSSLSLSSFPNQPNFQPTTQAKNTRHTTHEPKQSKIITDSTFHGVNLKTLKQLSKRTFSVKSSFNAMEALNAAGLTPLSVLAKRNKPRKSSSPLQAIFPIKNPFTSSKKLDSLSLSRTVQGGLALLSSLFNSSLAKALTYEEALAQSVSTSSDFESGIDFDDVVKFAVDNPLISGGGAAVLLVPLVVSTLISKPKPWGVQSAKAAYAKLGEDENAVLLDIRAVGEARKVGSPDIRGLKKKPVAVVYKGEDKPGFLKKLEVKFQEPGNTTLFVLDKFSGNSELVAELVTANGFKAAYAIKDGAEGPQGWLNSGLPWIQPKKTLSFDLSSVTDAIGEGVDAATLALGVAAAAGVGLLAFTEVETILQLLGSAALIQVVTKKLLFAEDRKQTLKQVEELLNTKVAPKELVDDIQQIGKAFLPVTTTSKALPAPAEASPTPAESTVQKSESIPEANNVPPAPEPVPEVNSVPKAEVEEESLPVPSRPLSPYPNYPDYKPPSSPIPSQP